MSTDVNTVWQIYRLPLLAAVIVVGGLAGALVADGHLDFLSWIGLAVPLALAMTPLIKRRTPSPQRFVITSLPAILMLAVGGGLAIAAFVRRHEVLGEMAWLGVFVAMIAVRLPHSLRNRANRIVEDQKTAGERLLLAAVSLAMMGLPLVHMATGVFAFADYVPPDIFTPVGIALQVPFMWLFWRSHADLGRNWSPTLELRAEHTLVTHGIYAFVRHPMYAAIWLSALTQPLLIHNWIAGGLIIPAFAAMWFIRVPREEEMMRASFGAAYDVYCARTGRIFPKL